MNIELLEKALPDECFDGIGNPYPGGPPCAVGIPKVNEAYIWTMAQVGNVIWFGSVANTHCLVLGSFLGVVGPHETDSWVCEFGDSQLSPPLPPAFGDARAPSIYSYNIVTRVLQQRTPTAAIAPLIQSTVGFRASGAENGVVFLAGPSFAGINMFAFNSATGAFIGAQNFPQWDDIRTFASHNGSLYAGVSNTAGGGSVLKWIGNSVNPFLFEVVGTLDSEAASLAIHEGRLYSTTWPGTLNPAGPGGAEAGLYMSPPLPAGGLTAAHAAGWTKLWTASDYEPDPLVAATYGGGALASFDGSLFWGTMHVPFLATLAHTQVFGTPGSPEEIMALILGTFRSISIFRGRNLDSGTPEIDLLYGLPALPRYTPGANPGDPGIWELAPNNAGSIPLFGGPGFWNPFNNYTWSMAVYDGRLWVGTMDWGYLLDQMMPLILDLLGATSPLELNLPRQLYGADLYSFPDSDSPAIPESVTGVGNPMNYGIRNMIGSDALFLGSANPMNLLTDSDPLGGWELLSLTKKQPNTPAGSDVEQMLAPDGSFVAFCEVTASGHTAARMIDNPFSEGIPPRLDPAVSEMSPELRNLLFRIYYPAGPHVRNPLPERVMFVESTAAWRNGDCGEGMKAQVCLTTEDPTQAALYQFMPEGQGDALWKNITTSRTDSQVCGTVTDPTLGAFALMRIEKDIPTLSEWALILFSLLLIVTGSWFLGAWRPL